MMRIARTACVVVVAVAASSAGFCESIFDVEGDALLPDVGTLPSLPSYGWGGGTIQLSPGYTYTNLESEDLTLTTNVFTITGYSKGISVDAGPISLQPLLQGAGWWTAGYGTAELEWTNPTPPPPTETEDGETFAFDAAAVGDNGVGMRVGYSFIGADNDNLWIETASLSVLFDYMRGGRLALTASTSDLMLGPFLGLYVIDNTVNWGVDWTHVVDLSGMWLSLGASWARIEHRIEGALPIDFGDRAMVRAAIYPTVEFGITALGMQERGDTGDRDGYGGGVIVDMEQVRLSVEFRRTDVDGAPTESSEQLTISLGMRF